jgi:phenylacetic acid degradation operon negative regulatory protein
LTGGATHTARAAGDGWPALDTLLAVLRTEPSRTGSVIATVYGDAILPRGGSLALADLLTLMRRLGVAEGVVRTAVSRLAQDGLLIGRRVGRRSAYALTERGRAEFLAAAPRIYGRASPGWDGRLRLAFPDTAAGRQSLEAAGFASLAPGVLASPGPGPADILCVEASGPSARLAALAARAWPLERLGGLYAGFVEMFSALEPPPDVAPLDAMAARILLIHAWRRIALRDPALPPALLPPHWPGGRARRLCLTLYGAMAVASEHWLDAASGGDEALPRGLDPAARFDG